MTRVDESGIVGEFPNVRFAPDGWKLEDENPFIGGPFDSKWTGLFLADASNDQYWNGTSASGLFSVSFNRRVFDLGQRVYDFLLYEKAAGRFVVVGTDASRESRAHLAELLRRAGRATGIRSADARYVVHSTTRTAWVSISRTGVLKAPTALQSEGIAVDPVGQRLLGDPQDFLDYIHFAPYESINPEFVVLSRQQARITCDPHASYRPGARIYLDNHQMIADGLVVRDGFHHSKVKGQLELSRYMVSSVAPPAGHESWTPRSFCSYATAQFRRFSPVATTPGARQRAQVPRLQASESPPGQG